jgi:hypothetical protein
MPANATTIINNLSWVLRNKRTDISVVMMVVVVWSRGPRSPTDDDSTRVRNRNIQNDEAAFNLVKKKRNKKK